MVKLILYNRADKYDSTSSCLFIEKPKHNMFETILPREFNLQVGFSLCQPEDRFEKKIARELAQKRFKYRTLKLQSVTDDFVHYMILEDGFTIMISFNINTGRVDGFTVYKNN